MISVFAASVECLSDSEIFDELYKEVTPTRQKKISILRQKKDKELSLGAGLIASKVLKGFGIDINSETVLTAPNGKPYFKNGKIEFNLSHSENYVICAVSDKPVGCDIEFIGHYKEEIAKRFFASDEYEYISSFDTEEGRKNAFFGVWTAKESFVKAIGCGLTIPTNSFSVISDKFGIVNQNILNDDFYINILDDIENYKCSVCSLYGDRPNVEFLSLI